MAIRLAPGARLLVDIFPRGVRHLADLALRDRKTFAVFLPLLSSASLSSIRARQVVEMEDSARRAIRSI
jgi:hypothetical protein